MASINQVFSMLSWTGDEETQQEGIRAAQEIEYLSVLFQPIESKSVWENCAKVLASKSDDVLSTRKNTKGPSPCVLTSSMVTTMEVK